MAPITIQPDKTFRVRCVMTTESLQEIQGLRKKTNNTLVVLGSNHFMGGFLRFNEVFGAWGPMDPGATHHGILEFQILDQPGEPTAPFFPLLYAIQAAG